MPLNRKTLVLFFAKVAGWYAAFLILWPVLGGAYAHLFCVTGDAVFSSFGSAGRTDFVLIEPRPAGNKAQDFEIKLANLQAQRTGTFEPDRNTRNMGYLPTVFTAALVLATPVSWRRRGLALIWAAVLISAFIGLQIALHLFNAYSDPNVIKQFNIAPLTKQLLVIALKVVALSPVTAYIAPVFIWIIATFRRGDFAGPPSGLSSHPESAS